MCSSSVSECVFLLKNRCFWRGGEGCGSLAKAQATARVDVPTTLSLPLWSIVVLERGPYSCPAMMKMKVKHIHTCHSHCISEARARARCYCRQVEPVKPKRAYHQPSRELRSWVVDYALLQRKAVNREMLAMCSFPFCEESAAVLMQPTFDRGRATWHDAQIRHTMDLPSMQDGRGALHRHDFDGRDHDRHHHGWRAPRHEWYRTCQNMRRFPTAHLDPAAPEAGLQFFAESVCRDEVVLDLRLSTTKRPCTDAHSLSAHHT